MFFHVLSCSFMFFHFQSFSFILFHSLSFSFSLLGAGNLIFWEASIWCRFLLTFYVKTNQFFGPSRVVKQFNFSARLGGLKKTFEASFLFFSPFFSPVFFVFFLAFFSFFVHFFFF